MTRTRYLSPSFFPVPVVLCLLLCGAGQTFAESPPPVELEPIVVVASKTPRPVSEVAGQVTVIDSDHIETWLLEDLDDLFRFAPGLEVETAGTRFGTRGISLRGIGGNRVAVEVDGVPLRDRFSIGSYSNAGNDLLDTARIERVEVLHGPASSLYGSDALGGVVAFTTFDPDDLLARGNGARWYGLRSGWRDADQAWSNTLTLAQGAGAHGFLASVTRRDGHESEPAAYPSGDPQSWSSEDWVARYTWDTPSANRLRLSVEQMQRDATTQVESILGYARFRDTAVLIGDDRDEAARWLADFEFAGAGWDHGVVRAFGADSETFQRTHETRPTGRSPSQYLREFRYETRLEGIEVNAFRSRITGPAVHRLGIGIEWTRTHSETLRDGWQQRLGSGQITRTVLGETLPVRDFPNARVDEIGAFVQDEIHVGAWDIIPALRWDRFDLDPQPDAVYLEDYPDTAVVEVRDTEITPRIGVVRRLDAGWSIYGQYVRGFRAPPHEDVNIGLDIALFKYRAVPNPDLKAERSEGIELGIRRFLPNGQFSLAWFRTDYREFIESRVPIGLDTESGYLLFQSVNRERARISGFDLRFERALPGTWKDTSFHAAMHWSRGDDLERMQPLNSVSPPQAVLGLSWQSGNGAWSADLDGVFTRRQDRIDHTGNARFEVPGYATLDASVGYRFTGGPELRLVVRNLADRTYWRWSDVSGLAHDDPMVLRLAQPGRSLGFSVRFGW